MLSWQPPPSRPPITPTTVEPVIHGPPLVPSTSPPQRSEGYPPEVHARDRVAAQRRSADAQRVPDHRHRRGVARCHAQRQRPTGDRFDSPARGAADPRERIVGLGVLGGEPAGIEVDGVDRPHVVGGGLVVERRYERDGDARRQAVCRGQDQILARGVDHRRGARVGIGAAEEQRPDRRLGRHRLGALGHGLCDGGLGGFDRAVRTACGSRPPAPWPPPGSVPPKPSASARSCLMRGLRTRRDHSPRGTTGTSTCVVQHRRYRWRRPESKRHWLSRYKGTTPRPGTARRRRR